MNRLYEFLAALSQLLNAATGGHRDQTFSARCYEAAVVKGYRLWLLPYWAVNGVAYAIRWALNRVAGLPVRLPANHCKDAYFSPEFGPFRTYQGD